MSATLSRSNPDGWTDGCMHGRTVAWMDGLMDGPVDRWAGGWVCMHVGTVGRSGMGKNVTSVLVPVECSGSSNGSRDMGFFQQGGMHGSPPCYL